MPRYRLDLEYDGSSFSGWQGQRDGTGIANLLEAALFGMLGERVTVIGAGRTDRGVHATGQVAHVDLARDIPCHVLVSGLTAWLRPRPVSVLGARPAEEGFHARFSARQRLYLYRILPRAAPPALDRMRVWHLFRAPDIGAMQEAAAFLPGTRDFTSFRSAACQADSPVRTLDRLEVVPDPSGEIHILAEARSFLHHQVRAITGTLVQTGLGKWPPGRMQDILAARNRQAAGPNAPPYGLYLRGVRYPAPGIREQGHGKDAGTV